MAPGPSQTDAEISIAAQAGEALLQRDAAERRCLELAGALAIERRARERLVAEHDLLSRVAERLQQQVDELRAERSPPPPDGSSVTH